MLVVRLPLVFKFNNYYLYKKCLSFLYKKYYLTIINKMQIDNKLTNFEIDRLVSERRLNRISHNNAHLGLMDLNSVVDKYHFGKQHKIPTPKPILENDLLGTNISSKKITSSKFTYKFK